MCQNIVECVGLKMCQNIKISLDSQIDPISHLNPYAASD